MWHFRKVYLKELNVCVYPERRCFNERSMTPLFISVSKHLFSGLTFLQNKTGSSNTIWKFHEDKYGEKKTHWQVIYIRNCDDHIWWEKKPFVLMSDWHSLVGPIQTITCISITVDHDKKLTMALLVLPFKFRQQKRGHSNMKKMRRI